MGGGPHLPDLELRKARSTDLDAITDVVMASWPDDPGCDYRFPYRTKYPHDFWHWMRAEYEHYLNMTEKFVVMVVVTPEDHAVAVGVWDLAVGIDSEGHQGMGTRRDANPQHVKAYLDTAIQLMKKHFVKYGRRQFHLWALMTHPDFRRRGAGTQLCSWVEGQVKDGEKDWRLTVLGSPMGKLLYAHLGYELAATGIAKVEGEEEQVEIFAMRKKL